MTRTSAVLMWLVLFVGFSEDIQAENGPRKQQVPQRDFGGLVCQVKVSVDGTSRYARIVVRPDGHIAIEQLDKKHREMVRPILRELINYQLCQPSDTAKWMITQKSKRGLPCCLVERANPLGKSLQLQDGHITAIYNRSRSKASLTQMEYRRDVLGNTYLRRAQKKAWTKPAKTLLSTEVWSFTWGNAGRQLLPKSLVIEKTTWDFPGSTARLRKARKIRITLHFQNCRYFQGADRILLA